MSAMYISFHDLIYLNTNVLFPQLKQDSTKSAYDNIPPPATGQVSTQATKLYSRNLEYWTAVLTAFPLCNFINNQTKSLSILSTLS